MSANGITRYANVFRELYELPARATMIMEIALAGA